MKIAFGFAIVLVLHVSIVVLSHLGLSKANNDRERISALREQVAQFYEIDRVVGDIRHNVSLFVQNGLIGPERRAVEQLDYLGRLLDKAESANLGEMEAASLMSMRRHISTHREILKMVVADRAHCHRLLDVDLTNAWSELYQGIHGLELIGSVDGLATTVEASLRQSNLSLLRFVNDPDSMHVRSSLTHLQAANDLVSNGAKHASGGEADALAELDALMIETREHLIELVQATRGYLHLTNVVLAGEEQEFLYHARRIKEGHAERAERLSERMISESARYQHAGNWFAIATVVMGMIAAWLIQRDIAPPLHAIASAFELLSRGEECGVIPGSDRRDELGELAAAAQVFKEQSAETSSLLRKAELAKADLNVLNRRLEDQTAIAEKMAAEATDATRSKSEFLANMSHEIRTPMTAILGFTDILSECNEPAQRQDAIRTIQRNGEHLLNVINDVLDLSKVEAGKLTVSQEPVDIHQVLLDTIDLMRVKADSACIDLGLTVETPLPRRVATDETRLRQILLNLIGNAIKFTEEGRVDVCATFGSSDDAGTLQVDIIDAGIGIRDEHKALLFAPFSQADNSMRRDFGGTGLGLTISKRLAGMLGGDVCLVRSAVGVGSHFRLTIAAASIGGSAISADQDPPLAEEAAPADASNPPSADAPLVGKKLLVAEDGPDNQRLIRYFLERAGADIHIVGNGELAIRSLIGDTQDGCEYDCVLMDMQMPVLDGYEATRRLRAARCTTPIIALTAHAMEGDRRRCLDAGCNDYHAKPFDADTLVSLVSQYAVGPTAAV